MRLTAIFASLASVMTQAQMNEIDRIAASFDQRQQRLQNMPIRENSQESQYTPACTIAPLDMNNLVSKYAMNISDIEHIAALSQALEGVLGLGAHTALIAEANDASRTGANIVDGQSGDVNFPFGKIKPFATVGEINMCEGESHGQVFTGVPDGMGAYLIDDDTIRVIVQSESYGPLKYETWPYSVNDGTASFTGSHVHYFDLDRDGLSEFMNSGKSGASIIMGFGQVSTKYINLAGELVGPRNPDGATTTGAHFSNTDATGNYVVINGAPTRADWLMQSLCSAHLEERHQWGQGIGFQDDIYITSEEWIRYNGGSDFVGISMHAMDLDKGCDYAVGAVSQAGFEKIVEINPQSVDYIILGVSGYNGDYAGFQNELQGRRQEYGLRSDGKNYVWTKNIAPARIYVGVKGKMEDGSDAPQDDFLARNGLRYGKIYGFAVDVSPDGPTGGLFRDKFHKPRENGASVDGKFVALNWQWDGIVKNFRHDGAWEFQDDVPGYEGTDFKWWNGNGYDRPGAKTEHLSPDTRPGITGFVLSSTAGYFGHYYLHAVAEILEGANGSLPVEINATYFVYQGENDVSGQIDLGGAGKTNTVDACPGVEDARINCGLFDVVQNTFEDVDGLEVVAALDGLYAILQEDSGNGLGERMFITKLEHEADGVELDYKFIAQSGGKYNSRMNQQVGIPAGTNEAGSSHEFSGIVDLSGMLLTVDRRRELGDRELEANRARGLRKAKSSKKLGRFREGMGAKGLKRGKGSKTTGKGDGPNREFLISPGDGFSKRQAEMMVPINEKLLVVGLQAHNLVAGAIRAFQADRGGQLYIYQPNV